MAKKKKNQLPELFFGPLCVGIINETLDTELDEGETKMDVPHHKHVLKSHPDDYSFCEPHVASVIQNPLYIRDDFINTGKIEIIGGLPSLKNHKLLVAVEITQDDDGYYIVNSFYPISQSKVDNRRLNGSLLNARRPPKN